MCGIAMLLQSQSGSLDRGVIQEMMRGVAHRGPDGEGAAWFALRDGELRELNADADSDWRLALGHRRLSILDPSPAGWQPMSYRDRFWITYNGEVYNYLELRAELERLGHQFKSATDTEVVLAAYSEWGADCFRRFHGMWALVIVDRLLKEVVLSRDRLGMKPLYLAPLPRGGGLAAVSEIKQLAQIPGMVLQPDLAALDDYLLTGYEDTRRTMFAGVSPLSAGCFMRLDLMTAQHLEPQSYWFPERIQPSIEDPSQAAALLKDELDRSVQMHLRSDVPVGCSLSGGLDSSAVALFTSQRLPAGHPLRTFTVSFPGHAIDERQFADAVDHHLRGQPHWLEPGTEGFLQDLDRFTWLHDEPVGSLAQYAAFALARGVRAAGVTVLLSGQGGDEILAGYWQSYLMHLRSLARRARFVRLAGHFAGAVSSTGNSELPRQVPLMLRRYATRRKAASSVAIENPHGSRQILRRLMDLGDQQRRVYEIREMYLPRLLKWDDRNFMAFSVEGRYPLLDHRVIELALSFTPRALYRRGWTKEPLRRALDHELPQAIVRRRSKLGFETPQNAWLCGPLRPVIERWLADDAPVWNYASAADARILAASMWQSGGRRDEQCQSLIRLFLADRWLRVMFSRPRPAQD